MINKYNLDISMKFENCIAFISYIKDNYNNIVYVEITDLNNISKFENLKEVYIKNINIEDISFLNSLTKLEKVSIYYNFSIFMTILIYKKVILGGKMLENSVLNKEIIKKIVNENYGINITNIKRINRGSANIYNLDNKYILKEFTSDREVLSIEKEFNIIKHLNNKGLRVPTYLETKEGKCYIIYKGRIIIIQIFLDGYTMENNTGDYDKTIESATILGRLSKALETYNLETEYNEYPSKEELEKGIEKLNDLASKIKDDNPYKDKIINDLNRKVEISNELLNFDFDALKKVTLKLCHGDYSVQQLIYCDEKETAVIDFETVRTMPINWEIIRSYSYVDKECKDGEFNLNTFIDYVKEVMKYINLTEYDLKYMPYIYIFQLVSSTFGYKQYNNDYSKTNLLDFAFFRTNLCNYLYDKLEIISNELLKLK